MLSSWYWLAGCSLHVLAAARIHSLPEDTYAFPKYGVSFLNGQPVDEDTAHRWLQHGLRGGELEFLDQPWSSDGARPAQSLKEIGGADGQVSNTCAIHPFIHSRYRFIISVSTFCTDRLVGRASLQARAHEIGPKGGVHLFCSAAARDAAGRGGQ